MRHPNKEIRKVLAAAVELGWRLLPAKGRASHAWATLLCPHQERDGCRVTIYATPARPKRHLGEIRSRIRNCPHTQAPE